MKNGMYPLCSYCIWFKKETQQEARVILPDRYTDKEKSYCCTWQISQAEIRRQDELRLERSPVMDVRFERADVFDLTCFVFPWFSRSWQALSVRHLSNAFHGLSTTISKGDWQQITGTVPKYFLFIRVYHPFLSELFTKEVSHDKDSAESRVHTLYNLLTMDWVPH